MTRLAQSERSALCDLAVELGPEAPTLSGDWTVKDLIVHLLVREGSPAAVGIVAQPLSRLTDLASRRLAREDFADLVERVRQGPPFYSPFALAPVDKNLNTLEYFVHHEDLRRAQDGWDARQLPERSQDTLWKAVSVAAKGLLRSSPVGVTLERSDTSEQAVVRRAKGMVVVRGLPAELVLFVYGRRPQARVDLDGSDEDVAALTGADLGI